MSAQFPSFRPLPPEIFQTGLLSANGPCGVNVLQKYHAGKLEENRPQLQVSQPYSSESPGSPVPLSLALWLQVSGSESQQTSFFALSLQPPPALVVWLRMVSRPAPPLAFWSFLPRSRERLQCFLLWAAFPETCFSSSQLPAAALPHQLTPSRVPLPPPLPGALPASGLSLYPLMLPHGCSLCPLLIPPVFPPLGLSLISYSPRCCPPCQLE